MAEEMRRKNWAEAISAFRDLAITLLEEKKEIAARASAEYRSYAESMVSEGQCFLISRNWNWAGRARYH